MTKTSLLILIIIFSTITLTTIANEVPKAKRKRRNQEIKVRTDAKTTISNEDTINDSNYDLTNDDGTTTNTISNSNSNINSITNTKTIDSSYIESILDQPIADAEEIETAKDTIEKNKKCPDCVTYNYYTEGNHPYIDSAIASYWRNDLHNSYACICNYNEQSKITKQSNPFMQLLLYSISQSKHYSIVSNDDNNKKVELPAVDAPPIKSFEVLGPINVGKLEVDADPTFNLNGNCRGSTSDVGCFLMSLPSNLSVSSDLIVGGRIGWQTMKTNSKGMVGCTFYFCFAY